MEIVNKKWGNKGQDKVLIFVVASGFWWTPLWHIKWGNKGGQDRVVIFVVVS